MPKRKGGPAATDKADPEQYARFVEKARELECDDDPARFDAMVRRIATAKVPRPAGQAAATPKPALLPGYALSGSGDISPSRVWDSKRKQ